MPDRTYHFSCARNLPSQIAGVRHRLQALVELRGVHHEWGPDRPERVGIKALSRPRPHDIEGLEPAILERTSCLDRRYARDIVLERVLAIEVLAFEAFAENPLPSWIVPAAGEAHTGPAAKRMTREADAILIDERGPFRALQELVDGERHVARTVPQAVAAGGGLIVADGSCM